MTTGAHAAARFVATHIAPRLSPEEEAALAEQIRVPPSRPLAEPQPSALLPTVSPEERPDIDTRMEVRYLELPSDAGEAPHRVRVSVENTMLKHQLYRRSTGRPAHLPTELLCRGLNAIGYRRYENQFSKFAIRTGGELRGTISLHKSGKILITGSSNADVTRYLAHTYIPQKTLAPLGLPDLEARDEVISNIVVKIETPYTITPFLMASREEEIVYRPANFSSAILQNAGAVVEEPWLTGTTGRNAAAMFARRFHEPAIPRHKWAISFFKPNRMLIVGLTSMTDIDVMVRLADALAYPYRYEHPPNKALEDELAQRYLQKRRRTEARKPPGQPPAKRTKRAPLKRRR